jgi:hypothetical protein
MTNTLRRVSLHLLLTFSLALMGSFLFISQVKADVTSGLVGYWNLDETSGTSAIDSSGYGQSGQLVNTPIWSAGQVNGGLTFDGSNDYVSVANSSQLDRGNSSVTVAFWMKRDPASTTYAGLVCKASGTWCAYGADRPESPRVLMRMPGTAKSYSMGFTTEENTWTHVAFSIEDNGNGSTIRTYKDGVLVTTIADAIRIGSYATPLYFGRKDTHYLTGSLDEVRVYDRVLNDNEVLELAGNQPDPTPSPSPEPSPEPSAEPSPQPTPEPTPDPTPEPTPDPTPFPSPSPSPTPSATPFTIGVMPDTQAYARFYPDIFPIQTNWLKNNKDALNIAYVLHEGDLVDQAMDTNQWLVAKNAMNILDGFIPYTVAMGNHDFPVTNLRSSINFNTYFPVSAYENLPTFGGVFEYNKHDNSYYFFSAGGMDFMVVSLEFGPRDAVLAWANQLIADHPNHKVIILTHDYLYTDDTWHGSSPAHQYGPEYWSLSDSNNGLEMWENLVSKHSNIVFVFSGHVHTPTDGAGTLVSIGEHGNKVYQMLTNYQDFTSGGDGYLRLVEVDPQNSTVDVKTYSPYLDQFMTDSENQFTFTNVIFGEADTTAPSVPANLQLVSVSENLVQLTWDASEENESALKHYNIYRDSVWVASSTTPSYEDTQVSEGNSYSYTVSAVNAIDLESAQSSSVVANTPADVVAPMSSAPFRRH